MARRLGVPCARVLLPARLGFASSAAACWQWSGRWASSVQWWPAGSPSRHGSGLPRVTPEPVRRRRPEPSAAQPADVLKAPRSAAPAGGQGSARRSQARLGQEAQEERRPGRQPSACSQAHRGLRLPPDQARRPSRPQTPTLRSCGSSPPPYVLERTRGGKLALAAGRSRNRPELARNQPESSKLWPPPPPVLAGAGRGFDGAGRTGAERADVGLALEVARCVLNVARAEERDAAEAEAARAADAL